MNLVAELHKTVHHVLSTNLDIPITDRRKSTPSFPYIKVNISATNNSTKTFEVKQAELDILIFDSLDNYEGSKELYELSRTVQNLMKSNILETEQLYVNCILGSESKIEPDGLNIHAVVLNYKINVKEQ